MTVPEARKVAIITGASRGVGRALALALVRRNYDVVISGRDQAALAEVRQFSSAPERILSVRADIARASECEALVSATIERFGRLDLLVNNAGVAMWSTLEGVQDLSVFETLIQTNYLGAVYCTYYALPHLKRSGGQVVGVSSLAGKLPLPTRTGYVASKFALRGFLDSLRIELLGSGVNVLIASPGLVATGLRARALGANGRPLAQGERKEDPECMSAETCAEQILRAIVERRRDVAIGESGSFVRLLRVLAPGFVDRRIAARLAHEGALPERARPESEGTPRSSHQGAR